MGAVFFFFSFNGAAALFERAVVVMEEAGVTKAAYWCVYEQMELTIITL